MICNKCNQQSPDGSIICGHCGAPFETENANASNYSQDNIHSGAQEGKTNKKSFCTKCGSIIDPTTHLCPICDNSQRSTTQTAPKKPKSGKFIVFIIILSVLSFILLILNVAQFLLNSMNTSSSNDAHQSEVSSYEERISELDEEISNHLDTISDLESEIEELETENKKLDFYNEHIVVVSDDGTNLYHKYGCNKFDDSSFWAFNSEYAISEGFEACHICN